MAGSLGHVGTDTSVTSHESLIPIPEDWVNSDPLTPV